MGWGVEDRQSVLPILEVPERQVALRFIHRNAHTIAELEHHLGRCAQQQQRFDLLYLAFHGSTAGLSLSEGDEVVPLARLASLMDGVARGAVIHLGSCPVLDRSDGDLQDFLSQTGARAICGYTKDVYWVDSAAFDLALLHNLATYARAGDAFNRMESRAYVGLAHELGFRRFPPRRNAD
jgi:hypothetical protein